MPKISSHPIKRIHIYLSIPEYKRIKELASKNQTSISKILRLAVNQLTTSDQIPPEQELILENTEL